MPALGRLPAPGCDPGWPADRPAGIAPASHVFAAGRRLGAEPVERSDLLGTIGGLAARRCLHAVHPAQPGQGAAATGFALTLAVALAAAAGAGGGPLLWVLERGGGHEAGRPYAPGLAALGIDPADVIVVAVSSAVEALAAAEMGLEAPGLAGVVVDLPARLPRDMLRLGKRLSLRTQAQAVPCLLVHAGAAPVEMPVASRWLVASRPPPLDTAGGPDLTTAFDLTLTKNRAGRLTRLAVGWQPSSVVGSCGVSHAFRFVSLGRPHGPALSAPVAAEAGDRPAAPCGTVVCFAGGDGGARVAGRAA